MIILNGSSDVDLGGRTEIIFSTEVYIKVLGELI